MLLHDLVINSARQNGDRTAVVKGDSALDYTQLELSIRSVARGLVNIGVAPGERIVIYLNKRFEAVISYFAASLCGGVFVPANPVLKPAQVAHIINDCAASIIVTTTTQATALEPLLNSCKSLRHIVLVDSLDESDNKSQPIELVSWNELRTAGESLPESVRRIDNDIVSILYTSGSTGKPKGVVLSHRNMVDGAVSVASYIENEPNDVILAALPFAFDAGFSQMTTAFSSSASVVLIDYLLPRDIPKAVTKHAVTGLTGVPPLWNQLAKLEWPTEATESLRYIANTGGAMPTVTLDKLRRRLPRTKVFLMYGLTEAFRSTYLPPEEIDKRPTSIGKAIPNAEILVVREDGTPCDPGEPGELVHRGALVALGYWNDPERTSKRFKPVPGQQSGLPFEEIAVWSGDRVVKDEDGFIYFVARMDDMIKSSGYRISPMELEELIYSTGLVSECVALGIPHTEIGQAVVIVAQSNSPNDDTVDKIITACRTELPNYMIPHEIIWKESLPRNPNGKIDRKQLGSELQDLFQGNGE